MQLWGWWHLIQSHDKCRDKQLPLTSLLRYQFHDNWGVTTSGEGLIKFICKVRAFSFRFRLCTVSVNNQLLKIFRSRAMSGKEKWRFRAKCAWWETALRWKCEEDRRVATFWICPRKLTRTKLIQFYITYRKKDIYIEAIETYTFASWMWHFEHTF